MSDAESIQKAPVNLWKNFGYYTLWWCIWMGFGGLTTPVILGDNSELSKTVFWQIKTVQVAIGVLAGLAGSVIFTIVQNTFNGSRKKWMSWVFAIVCFFSIKILIVLIMV